MWKATTASARFAKNAIHHPKKMEQRMQKERLQKTLLQWGISVELEQPRTLTSAVTTAWGVNWNEDYIARDLMQNFFDANRSQLEEVLVTVEGNDLAVTAPSPFNLERLFYLGSDKGDDDVGQYGEGFKVAATCLLRDHSVTPIAASGHEIVCLRVAERAIADTSLHPVEYDFYRSQQAIPGTILILPGCSAKLRRAVSQGLSHFLYENNPLLGARRWSPYRGDFSIYESTDQNGHIFYRKLKRGEMEGLPLVLVINREYQRIEQKISQDRDRNAFGDEVMKLFYQHFALYGLKYDSDAQRVVLEAARSYWQKGHPLLREISEKRAYRWSPKLAREVFGDGYYARSHRAHEQAEQLAIEGMERCWHEEGRIALPEYFQRFGVPSARSELDRAREQSLEDEKKNAKRNPTATEQEGILLLARVLEELAPEVFAFFKKGTTNYTVACTETLLGALRSGRGYGSREVFLSEDVFVGDFALALATFLHEHAHIFGHDGSRGFTDALTALLEMAVRCRSSFDQHEEEWEGIRSAVLRERQEAGHSDSVDELETWLLAQSEADLRGLLKAVPKPLLKKLRRVSDSLCKWP
jgi:hypothetical protein